MSPGAYKAYSKHPEFVSTIIPPPSPKILQTGLHHHYIWLLCCHHKKSLVQCLPFTLSERKNLVHVFSHFSCFFQVPPFFNGSLATQAKKNCISVKKEKLLPRTRMDSEGTLFSWENFPIQFSASPYSFSSR